MKTIHLKKYLPLNNSTVFFLVWAVYVFLYYIYASSEIHLISGLIFSFIQIGSIFLLLLNILFFNRYSPKMMLLYFCFAILFFIMQLNSPDKTCLLLTLFVMSARGIEFHKILKWDFMIKTIFLILIVGLCLAGFVDNHSGYFNGTFKQAWGFNHPNTFGAFCYIVLIEYAVLKWKEIKPFHFICIGLIGIGIMYISGSRTMGYTFFFVYILLILYKVKPSLINAFKIGFIIITPLLYFISFMAVRMYNAGVPWVVKLDSIFTTRISSAAMFLKLYDLKLWGQEIKMVPTHLARMTNTKSMILDNAYIRWTLIYGILFMLFFCVLYMLLMNNLFKHKLIEYAIFSLYFILIGIGESFMINIAFNTTLLLLTECHSEKINVIDCIKKWKDYMWKWQVSKRTSLTK